MGGCFKIQSIGSLSCGVPKRLMLGNQRLGNINFLTNHYFSKIAIWSNLLLTTSNLVKFLRPKCQRSWQGPGSQLRRLEAEETGGSWAAWDGPAQAVPRQAGQVRCQSRRPEQEGGHVLREHEGGRVRPRPAPRTDGSAAAILPSPLPVSTAPGWGAAAGGDTAGTAEKDSPGRSFPQDPPLLREPHR